MFDNISPKYDFLNHFMSAGIDILWRRKLIRMLAKDEPLTILDIATGTGDLAFAAVKLKPQHITGVDISSKMIEIAKTKVTKRGFKDIIDMQVGDSEKLNFKDNSFDAVTVGFGVRNFEDLRLGLTEMLRVTKPKGCALILEFSKPHVFPVKQLFRLYSKYGIPLIGRSVSKDDFAYKYLPESVAEFPEATAFEKIMLEVGYTNVSSTRLTFGVATIYRGYK